MVIGFIGAIQPTQASTTPTTHTKVKLRDAYLDTNTPDQCTTPDKVVNMSAINTSGGGLAFDPSQIKVAKNSCLQLRLLNPTNDDHDFDVRKAENNGLIEDAHREFPATSGITNVTINLQMPDQDANIVFFCGVTGHRQAGMVGNIIVGAGASSTSSSPGFTFWGASITLFAIAAIPVLRKRIR